MNTAPKAGAAKPLTPEQQIKALQVQLRKTNEKALLFEAIVDVLKEDYGLRIVKKPSGKSSRKGTSKSYAWQVLGAISASAGRRSTKQDTVIRDETLLMPRHRRW